MSEIVIDLITPKGILLEKTAIPLEYTVYHIVQELVEHLNLPFFSSERTVEYSLKWVTKNIKLNPQQTLAEAGVSPGDQLQLISSVPVDEPEKPYLPESDLGPGAGASTSDKTIEVVLTVLDVNKSGNETFELDCPVRDLIRIIAKRYQLPDADELSVATRYEMKSKALGRLLRGQETLRSARVPKHDRLSVLRDEIAG